MVAPLTRAVLDIERHAAAAGWDQPVRLFALVPTADLLRREPRLAPGRGRAAGDPGQVTAVEQEQLPAAGSLEELLGQISWPAEVAGAALVVERVVLPPDGERDMPPDERDALAWLARHPQREEVRIAVGVLRDGTRECALRLRSHDADDDVLTGAALVPALADAVAATLTDEQTLTHNQR